MALTTTMVVVADRQPAETTEHTATSTRAGDALQLGKFATRVRVVRGEGGGIIFESVGFAVCWVHQDGSRLSW